MSVETIKEIIVDVSNKKYVTLNAKQYDRASRFVLVNCYNQGNPFPIDKSCYAFVRFRKPDNLGVFNSCEITDDGKILIELTEQMLAFAGLSYADIVILENLPVGEITENPAKVIESNNDKILSTMTFCIDISEAVFSNKNIASSYEYDALNDLLIKATEDYTYVMKACKISEDNAKESEINSKASEEAAYTSETNAKESEINAKESEEAAYTSETNAKESEINAKESEINAKSSEEKAKESENITIEKAAMANDYYMLAKSYTVGDTDIRDDEDIDNAKYYYQLAESYAHGESGARTNEEIDNAKYYYQLVHEILEQFNGVFTIKGTVTFDELLTLEEKIAGDLYTVSDEFVTDDTFKVGAGYEYAAGTGVFYDANGYWNCLTTHVSIYKNNVAKVSEVAEFLGI